MNSQEAGQRDRYSLDIPEEIETADLVLRSPRNGDAAGIHAAIAQSVAELSPWMPWAKQGLPETNEYARRSQAQWILREQFQYRICCKSTQAIIGSCGLNVVDWKVAATEIGYWLRTSSCGRGYMTQAVNAVTGMCFESLQLVRVQLRTNDRNCRSYRVAERCRFVLEGVHRSNARNTEGDLCDTRVYARLNPSARPELSNSGELSV